MDSTQSQMIEKWINIYNERYNDTISPMDIKGWDIQKYANKCSKEELFSIIHEDGFFLDIPIIEGCREFVDKLRAFGHDVFTVTAYSPSSCVDKSCWLIDNMMFDQDDIIFCNKKHRIRADVIIDDGAHNLKNFVGFKVLFDCPHNESSNVYDFRAYSYKHLEVEFKSKGWL